MPAPCRVSMIARRFRRSCGVGSLRRRWPSKLWSNQLIDPRSLSGRERRLNRRLRACIVGVGVRLRIRCFGRAGLNRLHRGRGCRGHTGNTHRWGLRLICPTMGRRRQMFCESGARIASHQARSRHMVSGRLQISLEMIGFPSGLGTDCFGRCLSFTHPCRAIRQSTRPS